MFTHKRYPMLKSREEESPQPIDAESESVEDIHEWADERVSLTDLKLSVESGDNVEASPLSELTIENKKMNYSEGATGCVETWE